MSTRKIDIAQLDKWFPPAGPCAFCGHRDRRHRLWDTFMSYQAAGEPIEVIGEDFPSDRREAIEAVLRIRPYRRTK